MEMTIKEFCEIYKCDISAIYQKMKRNEEKLKGHINKVNGKMELDRFAIDFLVPSERKQERKYQEDMSELRTTIRTKNREIETLEFEKRELQNTVDEQKEKIQNLENKYRTLLEKATELESENAELKKNQKRKLF